MLNNKGFTLVEVLATLVILGIIATITTSVGMEVYNSSKVKAEGLFIKQLNKVIDDYIAQNGRMLDKRNGGTLRKEGIDGREINVAYYKRYKSGTTWVKFADIINERIIKTNDFVNPYDSSKCDVNSSIEIYDDADGVFYYRYKLACIKNEKNMDGEWVYNNAKFVR